MSMSANDLKAVKSRAIFEITKVTNDIIRPNLLSNGDLWGNAERSKHSPHIPQVTREEVRSFFDRCWKLQSKNEALLQNMMFLWASDYDKDVVTRVLRENRLFNDSEIRVTFEGLKKDISDAGRSLIERIKLSKVALAVPGNPNDHAFGFSWPFVDWISLLYDQLDPILEWPQIDDRTVFLYRTLIDATYKIHRIFDGQPIDLPELPAGIESQGFEGAGTQHSGSRTLRESLELMIRLAEGMETVLDQIDALKTEEKPLPKIDFDVKRVSFRPVLNDTEFQVLLALYRIDQPQNVGFVRNEVNRLGYSMAQKDVTNICSKLKASPLGFVSLQRKQWYITDSGKSYVESDIRYRQS